MRNRVLAAFVITLGVLACLLRGTTGTEPVNLTLAEPEQVVSLEAVELDLAVLPVEPASREAVEVVENARGRSTSPEERSSFFLDCAYGSVFRIHGERGNSPSGGMAFRWGEERYDSLTQLLQGLDKSGGLSTHTGILLDFFALGLEEQERLALVRFCMANNMDLFIHARRNLRPAGRGLRPEDLRKRAEWVVASQ